MIFFSLALLTKCSIRTVVKTKDEVGIKPKGNENLSLSQSTSIIFLSRIDIYVERWSNVNIVNKWPDLTKSKINNIGIIRIICNKMFQRNLSWDL